MESATLTRPRPGLGWLARLHAVPPSTWSRLGFGALAVGSAIAFFAYPTFPNYDSYYALLWGHDLVHGHLPAFRVYRAPTEHPLAIAFAAVLSLAGRGGDRILVGASIASFVALTAGLFRLTRLSFTPIVAAIAAALLCTRFEFPFLAARGYLDITYMAIVVWAATLELERPRRGAPVLLLLAAGGLLRPEAWVITGVYFLWCAWPATWEQRARYAALAAIGPATWAGVDLAVTGDPLYSLHSTSGLADELGRASGLGAVPSSMASFLVRLDKVPVLIGAGAGLMLSLWICPRRIWVPGLLAAIGLGTFVMVGVAGLSVIDRYLLVPSVLIMVFAAVGLGGWSMLVPRTPMRRLWLVSAAALTVYGVIAAALTLSLHNLGTELSFRRDSHQALVRLLAIPSVHRALRCGPVSVPNHKLIPEVRWILGRGPHGVLARSEARSRARRGDPGLERRLARGVAIYPTGIAVFRQAIVDPGDDPIDQVPRAAFDRAATSQYYAAYVHC